MLRIGLEIFVQFYISVLFKSNKAPHFCSNQINKVMKNPFQITSFFLFIFLMPQFSISQGWEITIGGLQDDQGLSVLELPDGSFAVAGFSGSDLSSGGLWFVDVDGSVVSSATYPFGNVEDAQFIHDLVHLSNGGFALLGHHADTSSLIKREVYLIRTNTQGDTLWTKTYGGGEDEKGFSIYENNDGSFSILGYTESFSGAGNDQDFYFLKTKPGTEGEIDIERYYGNSNDEEWGKKILPTANNGFHLFGSRNSANTMWLQIDENGDVIGDTIIFEGFYFDDVVEDPDGNLVMTGHTYPSGPFAQLSIMKIDLDANILWDTCYGGSGEDCGKAIENTLDGGFIITGMLTDSLSGNTSVYLVKTDKDGNLEWEQTFGGSEFESGTDVEQTDDGGFIISGITRSFGAGGDDVYLIKTNAQGEAFSNVISGQVFYDEDDDCLLDAGEIGLEHWLIKIENDKTFYTNTDFEGNFSIQVDTGTYNIELIIPNANWTACFSSFTYESDTLYGAGHFEMPVQAAFTCSVLEVDIGTPFLRRCYPNTYTVSWCNVGTELAENASVEVILDPWLTFDSAGLIETLIAPNTYSFDIGNVDIGDCGAFQIHTTHDCSTDTLGQTHCVEVNIFPDTICLPPNVQWDGSSIEVEANCEGDSVEFRIHNIGDDMDQALPFIVIEDHVLARTGSYELVSLGDTIIKEPANGNTYRLETEQPQFHPTSTSVATAIEGCGTNGTGTFSIGLVNQYPDSDGSPFQSIDCRENIGSWDPNDKQAFPVGFKEDHLLCPNEELEYLIRFQNTGTDTAFRVVIRDTISEFLDVENIQLGTASHDYRFEIVEENILKFVFDNIELPDSNVDERASHGFVRFKIQQIPDNPFGTEIFNSAAIYFDFNEPVITNETFHVIGENEFCKLISTKEIPYNNFISSINLFPNPASNYLNVEVDITKTFRPKIFIYNMLGQEVKAVRFLQNVHPGRAALQVPVRDLPKGTFVMILETDKGFISQKFVKME